VGMYLLEYMNKQRPQFYIGQINLIECQCGSGKTYWCLDCVNNKDSIYYSEKNLYVTDTKALKESVKSDYEKTSGINSKDNFRVITYQHLAYDIQRTLETGESLEKYFSQYDKIFLDEVHQLFNYAYKYDKKNDEERAKYSLIINNLQVMMNNTTLICLSATPQLLWNYVMYEIKESQLVNNVIDSTERRKLKHYLTEQDYEIIDMKQVARDIKLAENEKLFIFANTIRELKEYQQIMSKRGFTTLALWNDKRYQKDMINEETGEFEEHKWKMTKEQLDKRDILLKTGEFDTQVLLLNGAYESGINIEYRNDSQKATIYVMVASPNRTQVIQARGRIRHDIKELYYLMKLEELLISDEEYDKILDVLEQLEYICSENTLSFSGKVGLNEIAERLNLYFKYNGDGKRRKATSYKQIKKVLEDLQMPYEIIKYSCDIKVNGKRIQNYYIIQQK
jgi:hypothetical protein